MGVGLSVLYLTLEVIPHPMGLHGAVWSILANFLVTIMVSRVTRPSSPETIRRIHGEVERFVYGDPSPSDQAS